MKLYYGLFIFCSYIASTNALTISSINPNSGIATGGNTITIIGTGLSNVNNVEINSYQANIQSKNLTEVVVTVPDGYAWGAVDVYVSDNNDAVTSSGSYTYLQPTISHVIPSEGPINGGTTVTIYGSNFTDDISDVYFDGTNTFDYTWVSSAEIIVTTPDGSAAGTPINVDFDTNAGTVYGVGKFTYLAPSILSVEPNQGSTNGGSLVTINGTDIPDDVNGVSFGNDDAPSFTWVSPTEITAVTPIQYSATGGLVDVDIYLNSGDIIYGSNQFTYIAAPNFNTINPNTGDTYGGLPVTITGSNFVVNATVTINGAPLTGLTITASSITGMTPALPIGTYDIVITNPDGYVDIAANEFTVILAQAPTLLSVAPSTADERGGDTVTITGNNFIAGAMVTINGTALASVSVDNATTITATIPALAVGVHDVVVTTPDAQTVTLPNAFTVTPSPEFLAGDLAPRGAPDGQLNAADLLIMFRLINELETPTAKELIIADVAPLSAPDKLLNAADALILQRAIFGDITLSNVIDNQPPQISITSPVNNSFTNSSTVTIIGMLNEPGTLSINGTTVTVDAFFTFTHTVNLLEGVNNIALIATDIYGNSQPQTLTINKDTQAPASINASRLSVSEAAGQATITGVAGSVEAGATISITINGSTVTTTANVNGSFSAVVTASSNDLVQITVIDNASNNSNTLSYTVGAILQILSPQASAIINAETVNIVGVFANENNSGINVNGETACTYNNNFFVNNLPLTTGANTLTATYTTESGGTQTTSINVTRSGTASYKLSTNNNCGIAPLNVSFDLEADYSTIQRVDVDYDNDGIIDLTTTTPATETLQHNYTTAGVYPVTAWVTTTTNVQQLSLNIVVNDEAGQDDVLQQVWNGMRSALISGNRALVTQYLSPGSERTYGGIFDSLMPHMAEVFNELSVIEPVEINNDIASYAILRLEYGVIKTYMINFARGNDGVWRIDSM